MIRFLTDEQRVFDNISVTIKDVKYSEIGDTFIRFKDNISGKIFELKLKEIKPKKVK